MDEQREVEKIGPGRRCDHQVDIGVEAVLAAHHRPEDPQGFQAVGPGTFDDLVGVRGERDRGAVAGGTQHPLEHLLRHGPGARLHLGQARLTQARAPGEFKLRETRVRARGANDRGSVVGAETTHEKSI